MNIQPIKQRFGVIGSAPALDRAIEIAAQVAPTDLSVLITGESGTGKEVMPQILHAYSARKHGPYIAVNCGAIPEGTIDSELFGHEKGSFTGAHEARKGYFEVANGGTIFLDEVGELPLDAQVKLLRALQEKQITPVGEAKSRKVDVRVIAATNRNLVDECRHGRFREDLFYRLNVFPIHSIPLRERREDIPLLAQHFLEKYAPRAGKDFKRISKKALDGLLQYDFPGNIRELENLIERAVILENGPNLLPGAWLPVSKAGKITGDKLLTFEEMQREHILKALFQTQWRVSGDKGAARILGLKDKTLFAKMQKLGIRKEDFLRR